MVEVGVMLMIVAAITEAALPLSDKLYKLVILHIVYVFAIEFVLPVLSLLSDLWVRLTLCFMLHT